MTTPITTNKPEAEEYYQKAYELFIECFDDILNLLHSNFENEDILLQKKMAINIITKIHHISEIYLAYLIGKDDVLKLINIDSKKTTIDFDDCFTIQANKLFDLAKSQEVESFFDSLFDDFSFEENYDINRKIRNKNMHSLVRNFNFDLNIILKNFLTLWHIFFRIKEKSFLFEFYKIILKNDFFQENNYITSGYLEEDVIFDINNNPFFKNLYKKMIKRFLFMRVIYHFSIILKKSEFNLLLNIEQDKIPECFCPNCISIFQTSLCEGYIDYSAGKISYFTEELMVPFKTLIFDKSNKKGNCFLCGFQFNKSRIIHKYCESCNDNSIFINHKLKGAIYFEDYDEDEYNNYILSFCLFCGFSHY